MRMKKPPNSGDDNVYSRILHVTSSFTRIACTVTSISWAIASPWNLNYDVLQISFKTGVPISSESLSPK